MNGEFEENLRLIKSAHDGYVELGMHLEALRTDAGKMDTLLQLGRYEEALEVGRSILEALDGKEDLRRGPTPQESMLAALVYQNRSVCYGDTGRYDEALDALNAAEEHFRYLGSDERLAQIIDNRSVVLRYLGRGIEALEAHEAAAAIFEGAGLTLSHAARRFEDAEEALNAAAASVVRDGRQHPVAF